MKNMIFHYTLHQNATQTLKPHFSSPKTTGGRRESSLFPIEPPHQEKHFNQSGILWILPKDLVEKIPQSSISKLLWGNLHS